MTGFYRDNRWHGSAGAAGRRVRRVGVTVPYSADVPGGRAPFSGFVRGAVCFCLLMLYLGCVACAQVLPGQVLDEVTAPGTNYDKAEFRLWYPDNARFVRAVLVLVPGANADGRPDVSDRFWQAFASRNEIALIGCHFTDKPHEESFIENYANAAQGSGQALLDALIAFSNRSDHPEFANAPLLFWGMSAGGEFNYEFTAWKPERVVAFVVNKGGIYFSALLPAAARRVPGLLFVGEKDLESRKRIIAGLFALNRRAGALWALAEEPNVGHVVGRSREMAAIFFEAVLSLRVGSGARSASFAPLAQLEERSGIVGELVQGGLRPASDNPSPTHLTAWFPTERVARAWQALLRSEPFER
jgi:dienelactone hydrolase